jgi:hypothetical protein
MLRVKRWRRAVGLTPEEHIRQAESDLLAHLAGVNNDLERRLAKPVQVACK